MGEKVCEIIPCKSFKQRIRLTKRLMEHDITPINLGNCLYLDYSTNEVL